MRPSQRLIAIGLLVGLLAAACATQGRREYDWIACSFVPVEEPRDTIAHCAQRGADGRLAVASAALTVLAARGVDPAAVLFGDELDYLNADGVAVPVLPFDDGPDYFVEGFARTLQGGKIGFVDEQLRVVIPPQWDFAFPFENGTAVVCDGCTRRPAGDEHVEVVGGRWGVIDTRGAVVVPLVHDRDDLRTLRRD